MPIIGHDFKQGRKSAIPDEQWHNTTMRTLFLRVRKSRQEEYQMILTRELIIAGKQNYNLQLFLSHNYDNNPALLSRFCNNPQYFIEILFRIPLDLSVMTYPPGHIQTNAIQTGKNTAQLKLLIPVFGVSKINCATTLINCTIGLCQSRYQKTGWRLFSVFLSSS